MVRKYIQTKATTLTYGISDSSTTIQLKNLLKLDDSPISASDIGDILHGTYAPGTSREEIFSIIGSNVTVNADGTVDITSVVRGLKEVSPYDTGGYKCDHPSGEIVIFGNNPQVYDSFLTDEQIDTDATLAANSDSVVPSQKAIKTYIANFITGVIGTATNLLFGTVKMTTATSNIAVATDDLRVPTQDENNALVGTSGTAVSSSNKLVDNADTTGTGSVVRSSVVSGYATIQTYTYGETITAGQAVYLKSSDSKVYKASTNNGEISYNYLGIALENGDVNDVKKIETRYGAVVTVPDLGATSTAVAENAIATQSDGDYQLTQIFTGSGVEAGTGFFVGSNVDNITKIDIDFFTTHGLGAGNLTLLLFEVTGFTNKNTIVSTYTGNSVVKSSITSNAINTFTFSSPVVVKPNTYYIAKLSAAGGDGSNYYNVKSNVSVVSNLFFSTNNNACTTVGTTGGGSTQKIFKMTVYSTSQYNYSIGDNIYLSGTAGNLTVLPNSCPIGKILSSTTISLGFDNSNRKLITSRVAMAQNAGTGICNIPIPKNTRKIEISMQTSNTAVSQYSYFDFEIGGNTTQYFSMGDGSGTSQTLHQATVSFNSYIALTSILVSANNWDITAYFYK